MDTYINFMKLEKVEFGGVKGNALGEEVMTIFQEFDEAFKLFTESKYNPLNPSDPVIKCDSLFGFHNISFFFYSPA